MIIIDDSSALVKSALVKAYIDRAIEISRKEVLDCQDKCDLRMAEIDEVLDEKNGEIRNLKTRLAEVYIADCGYSEYRAKLAVDRIAEKGR